MSRDICQNSVCLDNPTATLVVDNNAAIFYYLLLFTTKRLLLEFNLFTDFKAGYYFYD